MALPFTAYAPSPDIPGAYNFQKPDGSLVPLSGPVADQMKTALDSYKASLPQPVAYNDASGGGGGASSRSDAGPSTATSGVAPYQAPANDGPVQATPPSPTVTPQSPEGKAPAAPGAQPQQSGQPAPAARGVSIPGQQGTWYSLDKTGNSFYNPETNEVITRRGGGGASKATIAAEVGRLQTERESILDRTEKERLLATERAGILAGQAEAEYQAQQKLQSQAATNATNEALRAQVIQDQVNDEHAQWQKARSDYLNSKVNPDEIWQGEHGTRNRVVASIGLILGGIGAAFQGAASPGSQPVNQAMMLINNRINQSIRQQEEQIQRKGSDADNLLAKFTRTTGNLEHAKDMVRALQLEASKHEINTVQAGAKSPLIMQGLAELNQAIDNQRDLTLQQFDQQRKLYLRALAGSGGPSIVRRPGTLEEAGKAAELTGKSLGNVEKARELTGGGTPKAEAGKALLSSYDALGAIKSELAGDARKGGQPWTPEGQNIVGRAVRGAVDTVAGAGSYKKGLSPTEKARSDRFSTNRQALISIGTQLTGAGAPSEGEAVRSAAANAQTEEELINVINTYQPVINAKLKAYGASRPQADKREEP